MHTQKEKLDIYIKQMSHFDPDFMEMGARAVTELVVSGALDLEFKSNKAKALEITQAFIKQMQSQNFNVHAHAIKCVADMIPKLPQNQVQIIFEKTIKSISDPQLDERKRQIYGVFAGTMFHQANQQFGAKLCPLFLDSVKALLSSTGQNISISTMLINVISQFIRKWPSVAGNRNTQFDRKKLIQYLLNNVQCKNNYQIIRKSQSALGNLSVILAKEHFEVLLSSGELGLINFISKNFKNKSAASLKLTFNGVTCLSYVLKTRNSQLNNWANKLSILLVDIIEDYSKYTDLEHIGVICNIIQAALVSLSFIVKSFSRQLHQLFADKTLNKFIGNLIDFDVEGMMSYATVEKENGQMEQQQEDFDEQDNNYDFQVDEKCCRVRKSVLEYISILIKKDRDFGEKTVKTQAFMAKLGQKLIEQNNVVSQAAIGAFNSLIQMITTQKHGSIEEQMDQLNLMRMKSSQTDITVVLLQEIQKQSTIIFSSSKFNDQIKIACAKLIHKIIHIFKSQLINHQGIALNMLKLTSAQFKKKNVIQQYRLVLLEIMLELISADFGFENYTEIINQFIKMTTHEHFKIVSSAYKGLRKILNQFPEQLFKWKRFPQLLENIIKKLKQHDSDRIIKKNVLGCLGVIFQIYFARLDENNQNHLLEVLENKLKIEIQKISILYQIVKFDNRYRTKPSQVKLFSQILKKVIENLGSANFDLNKQSIQATNKLIQILGTSLDKNLVSEILQKSKLLFMQATLPEYIKILIPKFPKQFKPFVEPIIKTFDNVIIIKLIEQKIVDVGQCIKILKSNAKPDKIKKISKILGNMKLSDKELIKLIDQSLWGQICLGALGFIGNQSNVGFLMNIVKQSKDQNHKLEACSALGNIASRNPQTINLFLTQADKNQDCYVYIYILRQMLNFMDKQNAEITVLSKWLLNKSQLQYQGQSVYSIVAECIGKISILSPQILNSILNDIGKMSQNQKCIIGNSLRFAFEGKQNILQCQQYERYIKQIVSLVSDASINVRHAAIKSISSIILVQHQLLKHALDQKFWHSLKFNSLIHENLIIQVDYGVTKEKKDTGKPLRFQSLNFIQSAMKKLSIQGHYSEFMQICLDKINKQISTDLVLKRMNILKFLCSKDFSNFIPLQKDFILKLGMQQGILKNFEVQKQVGDERINVYLKGLLKQIIQIYSIAEKQNTDQLRGFLADIKSVKRYSDLIDSLQKQ